ncbi:MAG: hypothetical protein RIG26_10525 [Thalassospira sp.]|uniref:hypothetical protein n=1 Tax=Thalassospira sp. TaxID=1912094 RepID=UPI0032EB0EF5
MIKYIYPDGSYCYRTLHTAHAVFRDPDGKLIARAEKPDGSGLYELEIFSMKRGLSPFNTKGRQLPYKFVGFCAVYFSSFPSDAIPGKRGLSPFRSPLFMQAA